MQANCCAPNRVSHAREVALSPEGLQPVVDRRVGCQISCSSMSNLDSNGEPEVVYEAVEPEDLEMLSGIDENTQEHVAENVNRMTLTKSIASNNMIPRMVMQPSSSNMTRTILSPSMESMKPIAEYSKLR